MDPTLSSVTYWIYYRFCWYYCRSLTLTIVRNLGILRDSCSPSESPWDSPPYCPGRVTVLPLLPQAAWHFCTVRAATGWLWGRSLSAVYSTVQYTVQYTVQSNPSIGLKSSAWVLIYKMHPARPQRVFWPQNSWEIRVDGTNTFLENIIVNGKFPQ